VQRSVWLRAVCMAACGMREGEREGPWRARIDRERRAAHLMLAQGRGQKGKGRVEIARKVVWKEWLPRVPTSVAAVRFRTDSEPEPNPNRTSVQVQRCAKDRTEPQMRFGVQRLLDFSEQVRTSPNLCEPQMCLLCMAPPWADPPSELAASDNSP
jgi:hypothetical protein